MTPDLFSLPEPKAKRGDIMKVLKIAAILAAIALSASGCAAVLVGALMYDHIASREERAKFTKDFAQQNLEREKAGLPRLVWCEELYRFNQNWYAEDKTCAQARDKP